MKKFIFIISVLLFTGLMAFNFGYSSIESNISSADQLYLHDENDSTYCNIQDYKCSSDSSTCSYSDKDRNSKSCCSFESSEEN